MSQRIDAARNVMTELAVHLLLLEIDADSARIVAMMDETALRRRSRGPYSQENLPSEAMEMVDWVKLHLYHSPERPGFLVEAGGPWPALLLRFPHSGVLVRYVVPEAAPPVYVAPPGEWDLTGLVLRALEMLSHSLRAVAARFGGEPPLTLSLSYPDNPAYEAERARSSAPDRVVPVLPTLDIDRSGFSAEQRAVHDAALRAATYEKWFERLGRTGFTMNTGGARIRDAGG
ncbi:hypothetical protein ACGFT2_22975 [Streptomyces sp. NPDC048514]|uniref:hypothetical protein n=1 Tax=Streptomyces sp. NPDC048514 TaxID=3365564 RepID=UPI00371BCA5D